MIGRLRGIITDRGIDGSCIVDVNGVGYECFVPLRSLSRLPESPESVELHVHTHAREDALILYAFEDGPDRAAFRTLLTVSNVGPKLALAILSSMDARTLASAIATQDKTRFKGIPGVGKRTVDRLLLELKDKLDFATLPTSVPTEGPSSAIRVETPSSDLGQVTALLVSMGFKPVEASRAVAAIGEQTPDAPIETLLKQALAQLA